MIGILTFHESGNYGAVLQAYALNKTINEHGNECEIIDYRCNAISIHHRIENATAPKKNPAAWIRSRIASSFYRTRAALFDTFLREECKCSSRKYNVTNIMESNHVYDSFVSGSDQIFNLKLTGGDRTYFLGFVDTDKKKIAYAASCGKYISEIGKDAQAVEMIQSFDGVSCRESQLSELLMTQFGIPSSVVPDPSFLLTSDQWKAVSAPQCIRSPYILVYFVSPKKDYYRFVTQLKKSTGLPVYLINYSAAIRMETGVHNLRKVSPQMFLSLFQHAEYVVTNSFHGTAFSVLFNRTFWTLRDTTRSLGNQRIQQMLELMQLQDRFVDYASSPVPGEMSYEHVNEYIKAERAIGIDFLSRYGVIQ